MSGNFKPLFGTPLNLAHPLAQGLVGCWLFNEGSGSKAYDASDQQNHGILTNMADPPSATSGWNPGPHGGSLALNGINNYVDCGKATQLNGVDSITISVLIKANDPTVPMYQTIMGKNHITCNYELYFYRDTGKFSFCHGGVENQISDYILLAGVWRRLTVTISAGNTNFYANDGFIQTILNQGLGAINTASLYLGCSDPVNNDFFNGFISDFMIYNRALSSKEISDLYHDPYCMFEEPSYPAWMRGSNIPVFMNHYRRMAA